MKQAIAHLDDVVHQKARLGVMAALVEDRRVEFTALLVGLDLTSGNLSRHLKVLKEAGYIDMQRGTEFNRRRVWIAITRKGAAAYAAELKVLRELFAEDAALTGGARAKRPSSRSPRPPRLQPRVADS